MDKKNDWSIHGQERAGLFSDDAPAGNKRVCAVPRQSSSRKSDRQTRFSSAGYGLRLGATNGLVSRPSRPFFSKQLKANVSRGKTKVQNAGQKSFGAAQISIGVMLDRHGPRRVQSALLLIAAAGAALFAISEGFATLVFARALIGVGVAAALLVD